MGNLVRYSQNPSPSKVPESIFELQLFIVLVIKLVIKLHINVTRGPNKA